MHEVTELWEWGQALCAPCAAVFTRPGGVRFVPWVTGMVLCWAEHPLTHILTALGLEWRWRVLEHVAEDGVWDREAVERQTLRVLEQARPARWGRDPPVALDDTTRPRTRAQVWGPWTFHEASARSPHRAETVRAHNWVVRGDLLPGTPWTYVPHAARLSCRQKPLPPGDTFHTKTAGAVELLRQADAASKAPILGGFDGAYAVETGVAPCVHPAPGPRRSEILTRRRVDARLYPPVVVRAQRKGRRPKWGERMAAPQHPGYWSAAWRTGRAWVYGRIRPFRLKPRVCRWAVSGPEGPGHVCAVEVPGDRDPWCLVTTAVELSAAQVVEAFAARFRQEDGVRDHNQRRAMEHCRAWTKEPVRRTFQVQMVALTLRRLLQCRLDQIWGTESWWSTPQGYAQTRHASIRDRCRLFWRPRAACSQLLVALEERDKLRRALDQQGNDLTRAA